MNAVVYRAPREFSVASAPDPKPAPGEVLPRVELASMCGKDLHIHEGGFISAYPKLLAHGGAAHVTVAAPTEFKLAVAMELGGGRRRPGGPGQSPTGCAASTAGPLRSCASPCQPGCSPARGPRHDRSRPLPVDALSVRRAVRRRPPHDRGRGAVRGGRRVSGRAPGLPALRIESASRTADGIVFEFFSVIYRGESFKFELEIVSP